MYFVYLFFRSIFIFMIYYTNVVLHVLDRTYFDLRLNLMYKLRSIVFIAVLCHRFDLYLNNNLTNAFVQCEIISISIRTSIAPVSLNNIETQWRCGLKSVFSGEVHSRKRNSSYDCRWMLRLRCGVFSER